MTASVVAPSDLDGARSRRSPYWVPGMSTLVEPWVALAESNAGHVIVPCGANEDYAREVVARWQVFAERGMGISGGGRVKAVGACVVDPRGEIHECWRLDGGSFPEPGGAPRWVPLVSVKEWTTCTGCGARRAPGWWVTLDRSGCSACQPERERDDPREWPFEGDALAPDPEATAKLKAVRERVVFRKVRTATRPFGR